MGNPRGLQGDELASSCAGAIKERVRRHQGVPGRRGEQPIPIPAIEEALRSFPVAQKHKHVIASFSPYAKTMLV